MCTQMGTPQWPPLCPQEGNSPLTHHAKNADKITPSLPIKETFSSQITNNYGPVRVLNMRMRQCRLLKQILFISHRGGTISSNLSERVFWMWKL